MAATRKQLRRWDEAIRVVQSLAGTKKAEEPDGKSLRDDDKTPSRHGTFLVWYANACIAEFGWKESPPLRLIPLPAAVCVALVHTCLFVRAKYRVAAMRVVRAAAAALLSAIREIVHTRFAKSSATTLPGDGNIHADSTWLQELLLPMDWVVEVLLPQLVAVGVLVRRECSRGSVWEFNYAGIASTSRIACSIGKLQARMVETTDASMSVLDGYRLAEEHLRFPSTEWLRVSDVADADTASFPVVCDKRLQMTRRGTFEGRTGLVYVVTGTDGSVSRINFLDSADSQSNAWASAAAAGAHNNS